jgi:hypothetical protein
VSTIAEFRGSFRAVVADGARLRTISKGTWYCRCGELADAVRANPRCDTCAKGGSCGIDCSLSSLSCHKCGATA